MFTASSLSRYWFFLQNFSNAPSLISNLRGGGLLASGPACDEARLWNGKRIVHPAGKGGLVGTILEVWYARCYSRPEFYRPGAGDLILDVGANVGLFSLLSGREAPKCDIHSYEACAETYQCLKSNVENFALSNVNVHHVAVGDRRGIVNLDQATNRSTDAHIVDAESADAPGAVEMVPFEEIVTSFDREIALLKMDIEGSEKAALGSLSPDALSKIQRIAMEYHDNLQPGTLDLLLSKLEGTFDVTVEPECDDAGQEQDYGMLWATRK